MFVPNLIVRCKACQQVLDPAPFKTSWNYMRWEYACINPRCEEAGVCQHRSQPQKIEQPVKVEENV